MLFKMQRHSPFSISWAGISFQRLPVGKPYVTMQGKEEGGGPLISRYERQNLIVWNTPIFSLPPASILAFFSYRPVKQDICLSSPARKILAPVFFLRRRLGCVVFSLSIPRGRFIISCWVMTLIFRPTIPLGDGERSQKIMETMHCNFV